MRSQVWGASNTPCFPLSDMCDVLVFLTDVQVPKNGTAAEIGHLYVVCIMHSMHA